MRTNLLYDAAEVLAGNPSRRRLVFVGAIIALIWIGMDIHQYVDFLVTKFSEGPVIPD